MEHQDGSYRGSATLPQEVKDRVSSTYEQLVALQEQGRVEEVRAGCELILKMDPLFTPARELLDQARAGGASNRPNLSTGPVGRLQAAQAALNGREFQRAIELCSEVLRSDLANEQAQQIARQAQERLEAGPFVEQFLARARNLRDKGNFPAARSEVDKARALDPEHPEILRFEQEQPATSPPAAAAGPTPTSPPEAPAFDFSSSSAAEPVFDFGPGTSSNPFDPTVSPPREEPPASDSSFIVDTPDESSDRTAQASDFGFSFEEEDKSEPTPRKPVAEPPVGEAHTFDFSTATVETTPEDRKRIQQLLGEGDAAYDSGNFQQATDLWSKIFLIDVTNQEASERIERARAKQDELEARLDTLIAGAALAADRGDQRKAKSLYEEALSVDPGNVVAREGLARLSSSEPLPAGTVSSISEHEDLAAAYGMPSALDDYEEFGSEAPQAVPRPPAAAPAPAARPAGRRNRLIAGVAAVIVVIVGAWFAFQWWSNRAPSGQSQQTQLTISRAQSLARTGKYDEAIALLSTIRGNDPDHDRVLELIADYKGKKAAAPRMIDGRPADQVYTELIQRARQSFDSHDYLDAKGVLERAAQIEPLPEDARQILEASRQQVAKLDSALVLFKEGNYPAAIASLESLQVEDPQNQNVRQLLDNAHFNLGAVALRDDRLDDAIAQFEAVLQSNPNDESARRSKELAERYRDQPKDLLYKIYVKYLPLR